jgi:hypothetical protein
LKLPEQERKQLVAAVSAWEFADLPGLKPGAWNIGDPILEMYTALPLKEGW